MYDELIKRLRELHPEEFGDKWDFAFAVQQAMHEAADAIEELSASVEGFEAQTNMVFDRDGNNTVIRFEPRWIPVTERLPENWTSVIVHRKDGGIFMWEYFDTSPTDECWIDDSMNVYSFYDVTHWMRFPEPPKEE